MSTITGGIRAPLPIARQLLGHRPLRADDLPASRAYVRLVDRQRKRTIGIATTISTLLTGTSLVVHVLAGSSWLPLAHATVVVVAMATLGVAVRRLPARRSWLPAGLVGLTGLAATVSSVVLEQPFAGLFAIGGITMLPLGLAIFAAWTIRSQAVWTVLGTLIVGVALVAAPASFPSLELRPAVAGGWLVGAAFGLAAASWFESARRGLYRAGHVAHERRAELVAARRDAARTLRRLQSVESIAASLAEEGATPAILDRIIAILNLDFGYSHPSVYLGDERRVKLGAQRGYDAPVWSVEAGQWVIGRALATGRTQLVADVASDPDYRSACPSVVSEIAIPLIADGRLLGVLNVEDETALDESDLASMSVVADRIAVALDVAQRTGTVQSILDSAPLAIVAYDANHDVRFWGAGAEAAFGWTADEVLGRPSPVLEGIDLQRDPAYRAIVAGRRADGLEVERTDRDGRRVPVRIFAAPFQDEPGAGQVVVYQDLTTERRAAEALAASEARYEELVGTLHEGVVLQDADGAIVTCNPAAERILGLTRDQMAGRTSLDPRWRAINEDGTDAPGDSHPAMVALRTREPVLGSVLGVHKPSGELTWVSINAVPVGPEHVARGGVVVSFTDITEQRRLQGDLLQAHKMDSVGRLAGGIAHDFNNLLTAILGNSQLLATMVDGDAAGHVAEIERAGERAAELTRQLLGFARKTMLDPGDHPLNEIVADMEPMLRRLVGSHIQLDTILDPAVGFVRVDRSQIDQVLLNLAVNGRDAMPDGGTLTIETRSLARADLEPTISISAERIAVLVVRDGGVGMDAEVRSHAFDPFFTTKPRGRGTGLGLATTHGIVVQSGGAIRVDSEPGAGSTFTIFLPEVEPIPAPEPADRPEPVVERAGTILLVEDEAPVRDVARRILERAGFRVLDAMDASAALELVADPSVEVDLIVSDVVMPGIRGPQLVERIRLSRPDLPAIFLSGYADLANSTDALPSESRFLAKPYRPVELVRIVHESLGAPAA